MDYGTTYWTWQHDGAPSGPGVQIAQAVQAFMRTHKPLTLTVHICAAQHPTAPKQIGPVVVVLDPDVVHGRTCIEVEEAQ